MISAIGQETTTSSILDTTTTDSSATTAATDFDTFLSLLVAQLRNQDPLQPIESTEFVAQLASFSSVEQQIETNAKLDDIASLLTESQFDTAVQLIGKEVESEVAEVNYDGQSDVVLGTEPPAEATSGSLTISDSSGFEVAELQLGSGQDSITWDGTLDDGTVAAAGDYGVSVTWYDGDDVVESVSPMLRDMVTEVRLTDDEYKLTLESGLTVSLDAVRVISLPATEEAAT